MTTYNRRKAAGRCPSCGDARDTPGRLHCQACHDRQRRRDVKRLVVHYTSDSPISTPAFCQPLRSSVALTTRDLPRVTCTSCLHKHRLWKHTEGAANDA